MTSGTDWDDFLETIQTRIVGRIQLGGMIKELRTDEGLSQLQLSEILGISESSIDSFEEGREFNLAVFTKLMLWAKEVMGKRTGQEFEEKIKDDFELLILLRRFIELGTPEQYERLLGFIQTLE